MLYPSKGSIFLLQLSLKKTDPKSSCFYVQLKQYVHLKLKRFKEIYTASPFAVQAYAVLHLKSSQFAVIFT